MKSASNYTQMFRIWSTPYIVADSDGSLICRVVFDETEGQCDLEVIGRYYEWSHEFLRPILNSKHSRDELVDPDTEAVMEPWQRYEWYVRIFTCTFKDKIPMQLVNRMKTQQRLRDEP
eukprot:11503116-Karenia_brevis.AAC.1